jgi:hypothetical protein
MDPLNLSGTGTIDGHLVTDPWNYLIVDPTRDAREEMTLLFQNAANISTESAARSGSNCRRFEKSGGEETWVRYRESMRGDCIERSITLQKKRRSSTGERDDRRFAPQT